jgi:AraC-like DNA-binding protein
LTGSFAGRARRNLAYTNLPISTIAYALGFNVSRFFEFERNEAFAAQFPLPAIHRGA